MEHLKNTQVRKYPRTKRRFCLWKSTSIQENRIRKKLKDNNFDLSYEIYSKGHRVPQGITMLNNKIYSVEHGPKGGDELNLIIKGNNYGWPEVSYGTNYLKDNGGDGISFPISHSNLNFKEPLFAFVLRLVLQVSITALQF